MTCLVIKINKISGGVMIMEIMKQLLNKKGYHIDILNESEILVYSTNDMHTSDENKIVKKGVKYNLTTERCSVQEPLKLKKIVAIFEAIQLAVKELKEIERLQQIN